jgi:hypothetical protein
MHEDFAGSMRRLPRELSSCIDRLQAGAVMLRRERIPGARLGKSRVIAIVARFQAGASELADAIYRNTPSDGRIELEINGAKFWLERQEAAAVTAVTHRG